MKLVSLELDILNSIRKRPFHSHPDSELRHKEAAAQCIYQSLFSLYHKDYSVTIMIPKAQHTCLSRRSGIMQMISERLRIALARDHHRAFTFRGKWAKFNCKKLASHTKTQTIAVALAFLLTQRVGERVFGLRKRLWKYILTIGFVYRSLCLILIWGFTRLLCKTEMQYYNGNGKRSCDFSGISWQLA